MQLLHLHRQISLNAPPPQNNPDHILDDMVSLSFYVLYSQYIEPLQLFTCVNWLLLSYTFYSKNIQQMGHTISPSIGSFSLSCNKELFNYFLLKNNGNTK